MRKIRNPYYKEVIKEIIIKAIQNGKVEGSKIVFTIKDVGGLEELRKKKAVKLCMKHSKQIFLSVGTKYGVKKYVIDYEIVKCYGDEEIKKMFEEKIKKD